MCKLGFSLGIFVILFQVSVFAGNTGKNRPDNYVVVKKDLDFGGDCTYLNVYYPTDSTRFSYFDNLMMIRIYWISAPREGPYTIEVPSIINCRGPKPKNITSFEAKPMNSDGSLKIRYNMSFDSGTRVENLKISVYSLKGCNKTVLWNYRINNPCKHFILAKTIQEAMNGTSDCVVNKGSYVFDLNLLDFCRIFFGTSFFYGDYQLKAISVTKYENVLCAIFNLSFKKAKL